MTDATANLPSEAAIQICGHMLTNAQAMAVRVAVTNFHSETGDAEMRSDMGPIADAYHARLGEVLAMLLKPPGFR